MSNMAGSQALKRQRMCHPDCYHEFKGRRGGRALRTAVKKSVKSKETQRALREGITNHYELGEDQ